MNSRVDPLKPIEFTNRQNQGRCQLNWIPMPRAMSKKGVLLLAAAMVRTPQMSKCDSQLMKLSKEPVNLGKGTQQMCLLSFFNENNNNTKNPRPWKMDNPTLKKTTKQKSMKLQVLSSTLWSSAFVEHGSLGGGPAYGSVGSSATGRGQVVRWGPWCCALPWASSMVGPGNTRKWPSSSSEIVWCWHVD